MKYSFFVSILLSIILISCEDSSADDTTKSEVQTFLKYGNGKFTFDSVGTRVQITKWRNKNITKILDIFFFAIILSN